MIASTVKVLGRRNASLTIHIIILGNKVPPSFACRRRFGLRPAPVRGRHACEISPPVERRFVHKLFALRILIREASRGNRSCILGKFRALCSYAFRNMTESTIYRPAIVPALQRIQRKFGFLKREELERYSKESGVPLYRLQTVASFFPHF